MVGYTNEQDIQTNYESGTRLILSVGIKYCVSGPKTKLFANYKKKFKLD